MSPCALEITGISGSLQIYGVGTALFLSQDNNGNPIVVRIHNCLCGHGEFNLISVSQLVQQKGNNVDFSLQNPYLTLVSSGQKGRHFRLPLSMDDGLFGLTLEPLQLNDSRYSRYPKCDVTPGGIFSLCNSETPERWRAKVLVSGTSSARILVAPSTNYDWNLQSFCSDFLAPPSIPLARRQYDPHSEADMSELSIRFAPYYCDKQRVKYPSFEIQTKSSPSQLPSWTLERREDSKSQQRKNKLSSQSRNRRHCVHRYFHVWRLEVSLWTGLRRFRVKIWGSLPTSVQDLRCRKFS